MDEYCLVVHDLPVAPERYVAFLRKASDSISRIMTQDLTEQPYLNKLVKPAGDLCRGVFSNLSNI